MQHVSIGTDVPGPWAAQSTYFGVRKGVSDATASHVSGPTQCRAPRLRFARYVLGARGTSAAEKPPAADNPNKPNTRVAGSYGNWTLVCGKEGDPKTAEERCSLVLPLMEKETQKPVVRVILVYTHKDNLVLRVDGPTGVALQRGVQITT